jgi:hypothetical protein
MASPVGSEEGLLWRASEMARPRGEKVGPARDLRPTELGRREDDPYHVGEERRRSKPDQPRARLGVSLRVDHLSYP